MMAERDNKQKFTELYYFKTQNESFKKTLKFCEKASVSMSNILLWGESGTGKEILAKYIHYSGDRKENEFVAVNCSSYSQSLLESELFGHEQGAFTGATATKEGKFEVSDKGTLFLDEVGDISLQTQVKLLRVLETKDVDRIGATTARNIDFRLISATNVDLKDAISTATFREDFFYRISTIVIYVPPLRERIEDLPGLIELFITSSCQENNIRIKGMERKVKNFLYSYDYPGNIRELKNIIDRMVIFSEDGMITEDGLPVMHSYHKGDLSNIVPGSKCDTIIPFRQFKRQSEREYLTWVLGQVGGNVAEAARRLEISTRQLFNKINDLDIEK